MVEKNTLPGWWPDVFEPFRQGAERVAEWFSPRSDASTGDGAYEINIELPGVTEDDVSVELHDGVLSVKGEKKVERSETREGFFFSERQYGRFQRSFRLPPDAAEEGVEASVSHGVLRIKVPRAEAGKQKARTIAVKKA